MQTTSRARTQSKAVRIERVKVESVANEFVVITCQRSGSNMFQSLLDSHPEIVCFGELMRETPPWMKRTGYRGALRVLEKVDSAYQDDRYRFQHPFEFVQTAFATEKSRKRFQRIFLRKPCFGFKIHLNQQPKFWSRLIQDSAWKIIVLQRENKLAQYSSWQIAQQTGQGNAPKGTPIIRTTVAFNPSQFKRFLKREHKHWERLWTELATNEKEYSYIRYTELQSVQAHQKVSAFLGVNTNRTVEPGTEKRNTSNILTRFSNPDEVVDCLRELGREDWAREEFAS